ncbi:hypothetical protein [Oecophyllibacter saccharovorans]|uniref:hypothetical protein n=1 Tax=Oecophyllibacter saccharovorans TaxID=2558360 RepID=UPI00116BA113|nr:hypothetical protein [Oecophyllibacter saccharovorans]TPW34884.1 hypothetical protein E3203_05060 [Oecophyllibacter saccharovorans]
MTAIIRPSVVFADDVSSNTGSEHALGTYLYEGPEGQGDSFDWSGDPQFKINIGAMSRRLVVASITFPESGDVTKDGQKVGAEIIKVSQEVTAQVVDDTSGEVFDVVMAYVGFNETPDGTIILIFSPQGGATTDGPGTLVPGHKYVGIASSTLSVMSANAYIGQQNLPDGTNTPNQGAEYDSGMNAAVSDVPPGIIFI